MTGGRRLVKLRGRLGDARAAPVRSGPGAGLRIARAGASADYRLGTNELPVQIAVADAVRPGGVFYDIGSNVGFFALLAARIAGPSGSVHAFEPVPANAARIRSNARRNRLDVHVHEVAIADAEGTTTLLLARHPGGAAVAAAGAPPDPAGSLEVRTATVDGLVEAGTVPAPTAVKIDVEGAEAAVLCGMATTMREHRPTIICEIDGGDPESLAAKRAEILGLLHDAGYRTEDLAASYPDSDWLVEHVVARWPDPG